MPTLTELQRQRPNFPSRPQIALGEEVIADARASMRPSQLVEQKLEARTLRGALPSARFAAIRPRAK